MWLLHTCTSRWRCSNNILCSPSLQPVIGQKTQHLKDITWCAWLKVFILEASFLWVPTIQALVFNCITKDTVRASHRPFSFGIWWPCWPPEYNKEKGEINWCSGRRLAQWVEQASHVPRLCSGPGFDSQPVPLLRVSCHIFSCSINKSHKRPKKIFKKKNNWCWPHQQCAG